MKIATDLEQSKKLAEILPLDSADLSYRPYREEGMVSDYHLDLTPYRFASFIGYPAWSLSALIAILPPDIWASRHYFLEISKMGDNSTPYEVRYYRFKEEWEGAGFGRVTHISYSSSDLIDACVNMIAKLKSENLL